MLVNIALATMFPPDNALLRFGSKHAVPIMFAYFVGSIALMILKQKRLMMVSFACCAMLCLHLRSAIGDTEKDRFEYAKPTAEARLDILQFNTSATDGDYEANINHVLAQNPDIIAVQEVTPDWHQALNSLLEEKYPHSRSFRRIDFYGLAIFSKRPFSRIDTFEIDKIPNIICSVQIDSLHPDVFFVLSHAPPPSDGYTSIRSFLDKIALRIQNISAPLCTVGEYHVVPWSSELQRFRQSTHLTEGRRKYIPNAPTPTDYILYSKQFNCLNFSTFNDTLGLPIGVQGSYQFRTDFRVLEH
jgi:endonuclease/exonuclease/phosphatase (EEP) superfamily protein YafD